LARSRGIRLIDAVAGAAAGKFRVFDFSWDFYKTYTFWSGVIGGAFLDELLPLNRHLLLVSGRASFEIVQKALSAAIPILAAVSAPSSLAVELAEESNQTLVGFLREKTFNIYAHPQRITNQ
jgi:hypothetical protein